MKKKRKTNENGGITLIALVVTIIVLLILAGISISMLTGQNGILDRAGEAKEKTEVSDLEEKTKLLISEAMIEQYTNRNDAEMTAEEMQAKLKEQGENVLVIQWEKYIIFDLDNNKEYRVTSNGNFEYWGESTMGSTLLNTHTANSDQVTQDSSTSNIIGIDSKGNTVNMLLWEFTVLKDGTYALNDEDALNDILKTPGYKFGENGENVIDGKIIGMVPQYISIDNGNNFKSVTDLTCTFCENYYLIYAPYIPSTVTKMSKTFIRCYNLERIENFPSALAHLDNTFQSTKIVSVPYIPDSVISMNSAFSYCNELTTIKNIPQNVIHFVQSFFNCPKLNNVNIEIPHTVTNMYMCFASCRALSGIIVVNANVSGIVKGSQLDYGGCFGNATIADNSQLILKCSENFYNLLYDGTRPNNIKQGVANYEANIILEKIN